MGDSGCSNRVIADKLVPFDLQQLSLALHMESLEGSGVDREEEEQRYRQA